MNPKILSFFKYLFLFLIGGFAYFYMEILYRGYSHFSMILCGGAAFILCGLLNQHNRFSPSVLTQMILSAGIITTLELITGSIVNLRLQWNVWDYSNMPFNYRGQICVAYSIIWLFLSLICILTDDLIRWKIFDEPKPSYKWF